ncbi:MULTISPECIES: cytochrome ubiquinol oxidase subunit I [Niallia]|jgi:cytochrome bd ubiquinol oxidase subunit I|uniref:Cytochrome ubiquinol oxidase subunit I n=1 Tax=Niallia circulans TaxID=1397 RepID=A0A268FCM7_NIACI|nr:cytochrome ubiquinol oxidase subunit I [Niallia circulans]AYV67827.1 cytochrome ubiquinol oxidase subunit I [Niallia circulans]AYV73823.1 cytochrome ubiquinol oxidase subunit I [Niallia circulans]PAD83130.1 cytochrome ubiquinol oxidase subunit I [Niallia circulans]QJX63742.1 cytochrome ubiquinol oxidase subunit I [Niallia circulans]UQZ76129.1 cytochrome ubiquinol oxidase subunit I [Niallia circulans]
MEFDTVTISRMITAMTLIFHIIFATLGVGVPLFISIAEFIGIRKKDKHYELLAKRWSRGFVITVAIGVVTGTAIALQLSLVWPNFMQLAGNVIALPLFMEVFAFFFEAIFLGIYLYTWDRFKGKYTHWLLTLPVVIGAGMSAVFITTVNSFMNSPNGFTMVDGEFVAVNPLKAMLNPSSPTRIFHVLGGSYLTVAAILATIAAIALLRNKGAREYHKKALKMTVIAMFIFSVITALAGDVSAKYLAKHQTEKLAAAEWLFESEENADLLLFGWLNDENEVVGAIRVPGFLSFLAHGDFTSEVTGLEATPEGERPPLVIHYLFDSMVSIGFFLLGISFLYIVLARFKRWNQHNRLMLWLIAISGPLAMLAVELGWVFAELGRQPWIVRGYMTVDEAATSSPYILQMFFLFLALYIVLGTLFTITLRKLFKDNPAELELEKNYPEWKEGIEK